MFSEINKNKKEKNIFLRVPKNQHECIVSKASTEIMLDRFTNGKEIDFPFSK